MRSTGGALFTCAKVRAVHLELMSSMSADSFLLALERFISRRGLLQLCYSDNGLALKLVSQEIGANSKLRKSAIAALSDRNVDWRFIPEYANWWGGFLERLVGSVKQPKDRR